MGTSPAAKGTSDYINRGRVSKHASESVTAGDARDHTKRSIKDVPTTPKKRSSREPKPIKPDRFPPKPHRMGKYTWDKQRRKLDVLFAIYVMEWETKNNQYTKWRYFIRPVVEPSGKQRWESDMLPYFHDDIRVCYEGVERLRQQGKYLTIETHADGYEVVEKTMKLSVRDKDLNFAVMAVCLLIKGVSDKDIQSAVSQQDDWTAKAVKRQQERDNGTREAW